MTPYGLRIHRSKSDFVGNITRTAQTVPGSEISIDFFLY